MYRNNSYIDDGTPNFEFRDLHFFGSKECTPKVFRIGQ